MNFASVEKIAAAILYEGYILYPYRPSAIKNRQRWNFGTLYPRDYAEAQRPPESFSFISECLLQSNSDTKLNLRVRFLQLLRSEQSAAADRSADTSLNWDEGFERTAEQCDLPISEIAGQSLTVDLEFGTVEAQGLSAPPISSLDQNLRGRMTITAEHLQNGAHKLRVELQNITPLQSGSKATRDEALAHSFVSAHMLLGLTNGEFISLLDPPDEFGGAAATCHNTGVFPVLAGEEGQRAMMLCSPIILYDYPTIAPESHGDFFDGTEMDEMLALRVLTLTEQEKNEMRNGDARARLILERTECLSEEHLIKVHGAIRGLRHIQEDAP
jgi:hypothetical protein